MNGQTLPDSLRSAVENDLEPVRPLPAAWRRALWVAALAVAVCAAVLAMMPLRSDLGGMPLWLGWGCSFVELLMGVGLVCLALREAVPGSSAPLGAVTGAIALGMTMQVVVAIATWMYSPGMAVEGWALSGGIGCLKHDTAMALPTFVLTLWLVARALPLRAPLAGVLGGAGAGLAADAIIHLLCPVSDLRHVLLWHTGTMVLLMLVGWIFGRIWQSLRWRSG